jgi:phospholipase/carboxylesterase
MMSRRELLALSTLAFARCESAWTGIPAGRLNVPPAALESPLSAGLHRLPLDREALLYVPANHGGRFSLLLHGATGDPERILARFRPFADEFAVAMLAPKSVDATWDAIHGRFDIDLPFLATALAAAFRRCAVDRAHLAIAGFSDGATMAIGLGIANGDLFTHVLAFSPGFLIPLQPVGAARYFLSHGTRDNILPIDHSRGIVRDLRRAHLDARLREFDGGHEVPPEIAREAFAWFAPHP